MERQTLPNSTLILIFGILSILGCCCYGGGLIFGVIAVIMANKATTIYNANPEIYDGYQNVKTGKILAIIGIIFSVLAVISFIVAIITYGGFEGIEAMQREMMEEYGG